MINKSIFFYLFVTILTQLTKSIPILRRVKHQAELLAFEDDFIFPEGDVDFSNNDIGLTFSVTLKCGSSPVIGATVTAILTPENGASLTVDLLDGEGIDPIDGTYLGVIYSCHTPGRYSIVYKTVSVAHNNNSAMQISCNQLKQEKEGGSVTINNCGTAGQLIGPGVLDLAIEYIDKSNSKFIIKWTEGWENTTIVAYNLVYIPSSTPGDNVHEWAEQGKVLLSLTSAQPILTKRSTEVDLSHLNGEIKIAIVAESLTGNKGKSNVVYVYINNVTESTVEHPGVTTAITTEGKTDENLSSEISTLSSSQVDEITIDTTLEAATPYNDTNKSGSEAWAYVGIAIGCLCAISGIVVLIIVRKNRKNSNC